MCVGANDLPRCGSSSNYDGGDYFSLSASSITDYPSSLLDTAWEVLFAFALAPYFSNTNIILQEWPF